MKSIATFFSALLLSYCTALAQSGSPYSILHRYPVEGNGHWDYLTLDDATDRLFISHGNVTQILNVQTGQLLATITDTKGVHGIALANELNKGYISNGKDNSVTVFDLNTYTVLKTFAVTGSNPDGILYDPYSRQVFAFNGKTNNATVIDTKKDEVKATIPLAGKPEFPVTDLAGKVYVNIEDKSLLTTIDTKTLKVVSSWKIKPGHEPSGLAIDRDGQRLFSVCDNNLVVIIDTKTGEVISSLPIGERCDGIAYDIAAHRALSANGDGTMTVIGFENGKYTVLSNIPTQKGARTIAISQKTHHIYLPTASFGETPAPTKENPEPRPAIKEGTFVILDVAPAGK